MKDQVCLFWCLSESLEKSVFYWRWDCFCLELLQINVCWVHNSPWLYPKWFCSWLMAWWKCYPTKEKSSLPQVSKVLYVFLGSKRSQMAHMYQRQMSFQRWNYRVKKILSGLKKHQINCQEFFLKQLFILQGRLTRWCRTFTFIWCLWQYSLWGSSHLFHRTILLEAPEEVLCQI